jgi:small nuclear ribonucleoprotein (snRNP)-like protein
VTDNDLATLNASIDKRVELTCTDGAIVIGDVIWVSPDDVLLDAVQQNDGTISSATVLAVSFDEIAAVRPI